MAKTPAPAPAGEDVLPALGEQLRYAAERLGLSERQVSRMSGLSRRAVHLALKGSNITLTTLRDLAPTLQIRHLRVGHLDIEIVGHGVEPAIIDAAVEKMELGESEIHGAHEMLSRMAEDASAVRSAFDSMIASPARKRGPGSHKGR